MTFANPVPVTGGATYVASYTMTGGHYSADAEYFEKGAVSTPPLSAPAANGPNGVYRVGTGFPTSTYRGGNYWVDVVFGPNSDNDAAHRDGPGSRRPQRPGSRRTRRCRPRSASLWPSRACSSRWPIRAGRSSPVR